tara:strand:- start:1 stop:567 length:567 start_codon:yes stop_codon:yes gene_type:complete
VEVGDEKELVQKAEDIKAKAELLYTAEEIDKVIDQMAMDISHELHDKHPLILSLMVGAIVITGRLLTRLNFPLQLEYVHATRYRGDTSGSDLEWIKKPSDAIRGRTVLIVDDILDEGVTLKAIVDECKQSGAKSVYTAVLADKLISKPKAIKKADFTGLTVPDKYVFGFGMDYMEQLRNCDAIYAVKE